MFSNEMIPKLTGDGIQLNLDTKEWSSNKEPNENSKNYLTKAYNICGIILILLIVFFALHWMYDIDNNYIMSAKYVFLIVSAYYFFPIYQWFTIYIFG